MDPLRLPNKAPRALVVIDAQGDFCRPGGALYVEGAEVVLPSINDFFATLTAIDYACVLFTYDTHVRAGWENTSEGKQFPVHCVKGTPGWHLAIEPRTINRTIPLYELRKGVFDMWADPEARVRHYTGLTQCTKPSEPRDTFFSQVLKPDETAIDLIGFASDYCVRDAGKGLLDRGFRLRIFTDLMAGIGRSIEQVHREDWNSSHLVEFARFS